MRITAYPIWVFNAVIRANEREKNLFKYRNNTRDFARSEHQLRKEMVWNVWNFYGIAHTQKQTYSNIHTRIIRSVQGSLLFHAGWNFFIINPNPSDFYITVDCLIRERDTISLKHTHTRRYYMFLLSARCPLSVPICSRGQQKNRCSIMCFHSRIRRGVYVFATTEEIEGERGTVRVYVCFILASRWEIK